MEWQIRRMNLTWRKLKVLVDVRNNQFLENVAVDSPKPHQSRMIINLLVDLLDGDNFIFYEVQIYSIYEFNNTLVERNIFKDR